ncbi:siderophore-interacting protein [Microbacterium sp. 10M-3C3]|uniref:siderophore-interacting protein n=1 Tax=Microbacterium sp. 10M-3C3 TaxID=2483401 RepID=UPI000F63DDCF|nr:siderophore-interacting protein [Microbacterium sp. 10M-3C3]
MTALLAATRPAYRPYSVRVSAVRPLTPSFVRITFHGDDLEHFGTAGLDQRVKLLLPAPDGGISDVGQDDPAVLEAGTWYDAWRALPDGSRSPMRTYTVRRIDADAREIDIDFVVHDDPGPAGAWAMDAVVGREIVVIGPDERSEHARSGIDWHPGTARRVLLVGDETAVPAIGGILDSLDANVSADVFVEIPHAGDAHVWSAERARVRWLPREGAAHGMRLIDAVEQWCAASGDVLARAAAPRPQQLEDIDLDTDVLWDSPADADGEFYAWIAGESQTVKTLRRLLVQGHGVDRRRVAFMGYWRLGQSERTA